MEGDIMSESKLRTLSIDFSVEIINLVKHLKEQRESIMSNQIGRSGTSIGANIHEAQYAHGRADFIAKLQIALKEASETGYWLELLLRTNYINDTQYKYLNEACIFSCSDKSLFLFKKSRLGFLFNEEIKSDFVLKFRLLFLQYIFVISSNK